MAAKTLQQVLQSTGEFLLGRVLWFLIPLLLIGLLFAFRVPLLHGFGSLLIKEDALVHADAIYVLGGSPRERGAKGAELLQQGWASTMIATGSNIPGVMEGEGIMLNEAVLSKRAALRAGADSTRIRLIEKGTSTWEEAALIHADAMEQRYDTVLVVSTEFHLRRVSRVFRKRFAGSGVHLRFVAANSLVYDSDRWWTSEEGLLMVNNEYVKLLYYLIKY